ncbi:MAG: type II toxin-antitoxin system prevent-host-death family antitoxin [Actinomycetota bacterium]
MDEGSRVGVRELRQNLSKYLRLVERGETLEVTERGHPVALLAPLPPTGTTVIDRLVAAGRATRATRSLDDLPAPQGAISTRGTDALREQREDRI